MKKAYFLLVPLLGISLCSGCSYVKGYEHDLTVVACYHEDIVSSGTVNIFNNFVLPDLGETYVPGDAKFLGWALPGWTYGVDNNENLYPAGGVVRYADVASYATNGCLSLEGIVVQKDSIPANYLTIGWYDKVGTSGLTQTIMDRWTEDLVAFLQGEGATESELSTLTIRGYQGAVADIGTAINHDEDCDILLGVGKNIGTTGGVSCLELVGNIPMGGKTRYIARLTDTAVAISVFQWLQTPAGQAGLAG